MTFTLSDSRCSRVRSKAVSDRQGSSINFKSTLWLSNLDSAFNDLIHLTRVCSVSATAIGVIHAGLPAPPFTKTASSKITLLTNILPTWSISNYRSRFRFCIPEVVVVACSEILINYCQTTNEDCIYI